MRPISGRPKVVLGTHGPLSWRRLSLSPEELRTHIHVIGKSGSGKSFWLANYYLSLLDAGAGVTLIDPHGDLAADILQLLIARGTYADPASYRRIIYLDLPEAAKRGLCLPLNILKQHGSPHAVS